MIRQPPNSTRTDTLFPYTTLCRSIDPALVMQLHSNKEQLFAAAAQADVDLHSLIEAPIADLPEAAAARLFSGFEDPSQRDSSERSEEHTSELQSLMRISYAVFCLKQKKSKKKNTKRQLNNIN